MNTMTLSNDELRTILSALTTEAVRLAKKNHTYLCEEAWQLGDRIQNELDRRRLKSPDGEKVLAALEADAKACNEDDRELCRGMLEGLTNLSPRRIVEVLTDLMHDGMIVQTDRLIEWHGTKHEVYTVIVR